MANNFPNLALIHKSIKLLYSSLGNEGIGQYAREPQIADYNQVFETHHQELALLSKAMCRHLHIPANKVLFSYTNVRTPGVMRFDNYYYYVELNFDLQGCHSRVAAVLAHELTHVFLHYNNIILEDTYENEVLTDVAMAYLGLGFMGLEAYTVVISWNKMQQGHSYGIFTGYITPEELGYIVARRYIIWGDNPSYKINSELGREAYLTGLNKAQENTSLPFTMRTPFRFAFYKLNKLFYKLFRKNISKLSNGSKYEFEHKGEYLSLLCQCPVCCSTLRFSEKNNSGKYSCPKCVSEFFFTL